MIRGKVENEGKRDTLCGCDSSISSAEIVDQYVELPVCESVPGAGSESVVRSAAPRNFCKFFAAE